MKTYPRINERQHQIKEKTSAVLLQSCLDEKWCADSMECNCHLRNIQDLLSDGKTPYERRFGQPSKGRITCCSKVEYHPISAKDPSQLHQFGPKVLPVVFLVYALHAGGIWKGEIMVADIEEWEEMAASEIHAWRLNAKEVLKLKNGEIFIFPLADGTVKFSRRDQVLKTSTSIPCKQYTYRAHVFSCAVCQRACPNLLSQLYNHFVTDFTHWPHTHAWPEESRSTLLASYSKSVTLHRAMSHVTLLLDQTKHWHFFLIFDTIFLTCPTSIFRRKDLRHPLSGSLGKPRPFTSFQSKQLGEHQDHKHFTEDKQITEHEDFRVTHLHFHQSITASTFALPKASRHRPPYSDLDDEQLRALLASPQQMQNDRKFNTLNKNTWCPGHLKIR